MVTTYTYYSTGANAGLLWKIRVDPTGLDLTTTLDYDSWLNVDTVTDPNANTTTTTWDALRRRVEVEAPSPFEYLTQYH